MSEFSESVQDMCHNIHAHLGDLQESNKSATDFHYDAAALDALRELREAVNSASTAMDMVSSNKHFHIPQAVSSLFTGREAELRELRESFLPKRGSPMRDSAQGQRRFVVYGLGGSGKTQFCSKFAQDNQDRFVASRVTDSTNDRRVSDSHLVFGVCFVLMQVHLSV